MFLQKFGTYQQSCHEEGGKTLIRNDGPHSPSLHVECCSSSARHVGSLSLRISGEVACMLNYAEAGRGVALANRRHLAPRLKKECSYISTRPICLRGRPQG